MRARFANRIARNELRELHRFQMNPPQSIERLADRLGLYVIEADLEELDVPAAAQRVLERGRGERVCKPKSSAAILTRETADTPPVRVHRA